ncbi:MAG: PaaI family thioesterase [Erythrobacter sp.]
MDDRDIPHGFEPAGFSPGFLEHGGPYYLRSNPEGPRIVGLRILPHHINYRDAAHGGVLTTLADVALSHAVYDAERPHPAVATISLTTNFLRPVKLGDWLECRVAIDRMGGRTAYCSGAILSAGEAVATMTGAFAVTRRD